MKEQTSAGLVVYYQGDAAATREFLLLHYQGGHWGFPKGKLESGETKPEAALRELQEETGIKGSNVFLHDNFLESFSYTFKDQDGTHIHKTVYFFVGRVDQKEVSLSHEHKGYRWLTYPEAHQPLTFKNAQGVLQIAEAFLSSC